MQIWVGEPTCDGQWYTEKPGADGYGPIPGRQRSAVNQKQVMYKFYKKPMAATLTMLARSAIAEGTKVATASAELLRRLKRTSTYLGTETVEDILMKYMDDLAAMGFPYH